MKKQWHQIFLAIILGAVIPAIVFASFLRKGEKMQNWEDYEKINETTLQTDEWHQSLQPNETEIMVAVLFDDGGVEEIPLETYLVSVVLSEMPGDFEIEALKAQAVVSRTYTLYRMSGKKHDTASVCTDSNCCQGYCSLEDYFAAGGSEISYNKIAESVVATNGLVLTYNDSLIEATYFSCSGGYTEDAESVWGTDVPYLKATESPGEEKATHYTDTVTFTVAEFETRLGEKLYGPAAGWVSDVTYTSGGGVDSIVICGKEYSGIELRKKLSLRSTAFVLTAIGDTVTITTKGFGHRVGMSQYGADAMAVSGCDFEEILSHYYKDTVLEHYGLTN